MFGIFIINKRMYTDVFLTTSEIERKVFFTLKSAKAYVRNKCGIANFNGNNWCWVSEEFEEDDWNNTYEIYIIEEQFRMRIAMLKYNLRRLKRRFGA